VANTSRFARLACVVLFLSLLDGRSAQTPPEPVARFRDVEAYSLFVKLKSDDDMNVNSGRGESSTWRKGPRSIEKLDSGFRRNDVHWLGIPALVLPGGTHT